MTRPDTARMPEPREPDPMANGTTTALKHPIVVALLGLLLGAGGTGTGLTLSRSAELTEAQIEKITTRAATTAANLAIEKHEAANPAHREPGRAAASAVHAHINQRDALAHPDIDKRLKALEQRVFRRGRRRP